jgi:hypothetical protein
MDGQLQSLRLILELLLCGFLKVLFIVQFWNLSGMHYYLCVYINNQLLDLQKVMMAVIWLRSLRPVLSDLVLTNLYGFF